MKLTIFLLITSLIIYLVPLKDAEKWQATSKFLLLSYSIVLSLFVLRFYGIEVFYWLRILFFIVMSLNALFFTFDLILGKKHQRWHSVAHILLLTSYNIIEKGDVYGF